MDKRSPPHSRTTGCLPHIGFSVDGIQARICSGAHAGESPCLLASSCGVPDAAASWIGEDCGTGCLPDGPFVRSYNPAGLLALYERTAAHPAIDGGLLHLPGVAGRTCRTPCQHTAMALVLWRPGARHRAVV